MQSEHSPLSLVLEPVVRSLGFMLHGIERFNAGKKDALRVYIDSVAGVTVDDCVAVHTPVARALAAQGISSSLEVSSPGLDKTLFTPAQLAAEIGATVFIRTTHKLDGRRHFTGELLSVAPDGDAVLMIDGEQHAIAVNEIDRAKLIPGKP